MGINGYVASAGFAVPRLEGIEMHIEKLVEDGRIAHIFFRHLTAIADGYRSDDVGSRRAGRVDYFLDRASGCRQVLDDERLLAFDDLVVSAFDDEPPLPVFVRLDAVYLAAGELAKMVCGPLWEDRRAYRRADDGFDARIFETLRHRATHLRRLARIRIHRVFQNIRAGMSTRGKDEMPRAERTDFLQECQHFVFVHTQSVECAFATDGMPFCRGVIRELSFVALWILMIFVFMVC